MGELLMSYETFKQGAARHVFFSIFRRVQLNLKDKFHSIGAPEATV